LLLVSVQEDASQKVPGNRDACDRRLTAHIARLGVNRCSGGRTDVVENSTPTKKSPFAGLFLTHPDLRGSAAPSAATNRLARDPSPARRAVCTYAGAAGAAAVAHEAVETIVR
jgi:hypothetical protein